MEGLMKRLSSRKAPKLCHLNFELKKSLCLPRNLPIASGEIAASENPESFIVSPWESEAIWIRYFNNPLKYPEIKTVGKNKGLRFGVFVMVLLNINNIPSDCCLTARTQPTFCDPASHLETSVHQGDLSELSLYTQGRLRRAQVVRTPRKSSSEELCPL